MKRESDGVVFEVRNGIGDQAPMLSSRVSFSGLFRHQRRTIHSPHAVTLSTEQVDERVSFIDPQSGIYTDGIVVAFPGPKKVEVGYWRSSWSDPK